jgi:hypothetical protein
MKLPVDYVFLHGGGQGGWVWRETIAALEQQSGGQVHRTIALDAPGCGGKRAADTVALGVDDVVTELLARLGRDTWPAQTMSASDWRYDHLSGIPSTYVMCLRDRILPPPWQETFATRLQVQRAVRIDAGHQVLNTRPHALAEVLRYEAHS